MRGIFCAIRPEGGVFRASGTRPAPTKAETMEQQCRAASG